MDATLKDKIVKVRKQRRCEWCGERIEEGEQARYRAYRFDGEFQTGYQHLECYAAMCQSDFDDWGFEQCQQLRGKTLEESQS